MIDLREFSDKAEQDRCLGLIVTQNQKEVGRYLSEGPCRRNIYSASKSFTSAAVGIAVKEGLLALDEKLTDAFSEDLPDRVPDNLEKATVKDLLTMCLGQDKGFLMGEDRPYYTERDWVKLSLRQSFPYQPGTRFVYNNAGPYLAGVLVQRRAGCDLVHYLYPRLFEPLGMALPTWEADPLGRTFGAGGLFLTLGELHTFGTLYLQQGFWKGRQLISREWISESTRKQVDNGEEGYGYLFWRGKYDSFRADGKYEQYSIIFPEKNAVVTTVAESRRPRAVLTDVYDLIYPKL